MIPENLNLNTSECIKVIKNFGHSIYTNICNGQSSTLPWGTMDWIILGLFVLVFFVFSVLTYKIFKDL